MINKFKSVIKNQINIEGLTTIVYGSTIFGISNSDLDVCFISKHQLHENECEALKKIVLNFHKENKLKVDNEIPFNKKLFFTYKDLNDLKNSLPFAIVNNKYHIEEIEKTKEFLSSEKMRKRLLLNILTVKKLILIGDPNLIEKHSKVAWHHIIKVVISYAELIEFDLEELLDCLYVNPHTLAEGEMYLGYKRKHKAAELHVLKEVKKTLLKMMTTKYLVFKNDKYFVNEKGF